MKQRWCLMVVLATALVSAGEAGAGLDTWRRAVVAGEFEAVNRIPVSQSEEQSLWRAFRGRMSGEGLQASRAKVVATNNLGKVCDIAFRGTDGRQGHFGQVVSDGRLQARYFTLAFLKGRDEPTAAAAAALVQGELLAANGRETEVRFASQLLSSETAVVKKAHADEPISSPFARYWFVFVDECPGAEWKHDALFAFVSEDMREIAVFYANEPAKVSVGGTELRLASPHVAKKALKAASAMLNAPFSTPFVPLEGGDSSHCYALLMCGGVEKESNHCRYWKEMCFVYNVLRHRFGLPQENIKVLWASGDPSRDLCEDENCRDGFISGDLSDFDGDGVRDITGAAVADDIRAAFGWYQQNLTAGDQLLVFVTDHGGDGDKRGDSYLNMWGNLIIKDSTLATLTQDIPCPVMFALKTCFGGGMIPELMSSSKNRMAATSDDYDASMGFIWTCNFFSALGGCYPKGAKATFNTSEELNKALRGLGVDPRQAGATCDADTDGDGHVSFYEAHQFALKNNPFTKANGCSGQAIDSPQWSESTVGLSKKMFMTRYEDAPAVVVREKVSTPRFLTESGAFAPYRVVLACDTAGATIRYTLDGSDPQPSSVVYDAVRGIEITDDVTVTARAYLGGMDESAPVSAHYEVRKDPPERAVIMSVSQNDASTAVVVRWLGGEGTAAFDVLRSESPDMGGATAVATGLKPDESVYGDESATPGQDYYYQIRSVNRYGATLSDVSLPARRSLMPPNDLSVTPSGSGKQAFARLSWAATAGATHYRVWRSVGASALEPVSGWLTVRTFDDPLQKTSEKIRYAVTAATSSSGANETLPGAFSEIDYPEELLDWQIKFDSLYASSRVQLVPGKKKEVRVYFVYADGTQEKQGFVSGVTWSVRQPHAHVSCEGQTGSYRLWNGLELYTPPSAVLSAVAGSYAETVTLCATYTFRGVTRTFEFPVIVSSRRIVESVWIGASEGFYMFPGEVQQLSCTPSYISYDATEEPAPGTVEWSVISGSGATIDEDGELTAFAVSKKTSVVVQARYTCSDGEFAVRKTIYITPPQLEDVSVEIPAEGGEHDPVHLGSKDGPIRIDLAATWLSGFTLTTGGGGYISLGRGNNNIAVMGDKYISFRADRNGGANREATISLRWNEGVVTLHIRQQSAEKALRPNLSVDGLDVESSCGTTGAVMHYALDGEEPTEASPVVADLLSVPSGSMAVAVKAFGDWFLPSDTAYADIDGAERPGEITVSFDPVEAGVAAPAPVVRKVGQTYGELPVLRKTGLFFKGWTTEIGSGKFVYADGLVGEKDVLLHAVWSKIAADEPQWTAFEWNFKSSMTATVVVRDRQGNTLDPSVCTVGIEDASAVCRGSTKNGFGDMPSERNGENGTHVFGVYGNVEAGTEPGLEIRVWHPEIGFLKVLNPELTFIAAGTLGSAGSPYVVEVELVAEDLSADLTFGSGKTSSFMMSPTERAVVVGVEGLKSRAFTGTDYYGGRCFVNPNVIDVEKTAADDDDDVWCSFFADMNLLYLTGWAAFSNYANVDAMAGYFRQNPTLLVYQSGGQLYPGTWAMQGVFPWFESVTGVSLGDAVKSGNAGEDLVELLPSLLDDGSHALHLTVGFLPVTVNPKFVGEYSFHGVTCCGYTIDDTKAATDKAALTGLFIIESDNDQLTGSGGAGAPNSIVYCPVEWEENVWTDMFGNSIGGYAIDGLWGQRGYVNPEYVALCRYVPPPSCGPGKVSEFALPSAMGGGRAVVVGVADLTADSFSSVLYRGNTWDMDGNPPAVDRYCWCFTGDAGLVDVEKDAVFDNQDDYWCTEFSLLNLAYYSGWIPKTRYPTVDSVADELRRTYGADDSWSTLDWLAARATEFGFAGNDVRNRIVEFRDVVNRESLRDFLAEQFRSGRHLVQLDVWGHSVTCCGYSVDGDGDLSGLFVIDSDNDMFNAGGAANAPNRITYCGVRENGFGDLEIAGIFDEDWSLFDVGAVLLGPDEPEPSFRLVVEDQGDGARVVTGFVGLCPEDLVIPDDIDRIGEYAFGGVSRLRTVTIGARVTALGLLAFDTCCNLEEVTLGPSLLSVGEDCFSDCRSLRKVVINSRDVQIATTAFSQYEEVVRPEGWISWERLPERLPDVRLTFGEPGLMITGWNVIMTEGRDLADDSDRAKERFYPVGDPVDPFEVYGRMMPGPAYGQIAYCAEPMIERISYDLLGPGAANFAFDTDGETGWKLAPGEGPNGIGSVRSGATAKGGESVLTATANATGTLVFRWRCETDVTEGGTRYAGCTFAVNGVEKGFINGKITDWAKSVEIDISAGDVLTWRFWRSAQAIDAAPDCAWIADFSFGVKVQVSFEPGETPEEIADCTTVPPPVTMMGGERFGAGANVLPSESAGTVAWGDHSLGHWYVKGDRSKTDVTGTEIPSDRAELTLVAQLTKKTYFVAFDTTGGEPSSLPSLSGESGDRVFLYGADDVTKAGYVLGGWSDGAGTYAPGDEYEIRGNVTMTALWTLAGLERILGPGAANFSFDTDPSTGWASAPGEGPGGIGSIRSGAAAKGGASVLTATANASGTLSFRWTCYTDEKGYAGCTLTVRDGASGSVRETREICNKMTAWDSVEADVRAGDVLMWRFWRSGQAYDVAPDCAWIADFSFGVKVQVTFEPGETPEEIADCTTVPPPVTMMGGELFGAGANVLPSERAGTVAWGDHSLGHWYVKGDASKTDVTGTEIPSDRAELTLVAQLTKKKYFVGFDTDGGLPSSLQSLSGESGDKVRLYGADDVTKAGYVLGGWSDGAGTYAPGDEYEIRGNVTMTAAWEPDWAGALGCSGANIAFSTTGDLEWFITANDVSPDTPGMVQSGWIKEKQKSSFSAVVGEDGEMTFSWRVSCDDEFDTQYARAVYLVNGVEKARISSQSGDGWRTVTLADLKEGDVVTWVFEKTASAFSKPDAGAKEDRVCLKSLVWTPDRPAGYSFTISWAANAGVLGATYSIGGGEQDVPAVSGQPIEVPVGKTISVKGLADTNGWYVISSGDGDFSVAGATTITAKKLDSGSLPQGLTPAKLGFGNGPFATADLDELAKVVGWAEANGKTVADMNKLTFSQTGDPVGNDAAAYLLNCAPSAVAAESAKFKVTGFASDGQGGWTITPADGSAYGNGKVEVRKSATLAGPYTKDAVEQDGRLFNRLYLVK